MAYRFRLIVALFLSLFCFNVFAAYYDVINGKAGAYSLSESESKFSNYLRANYSGYSLYAVSFIQVGSDLYEYRFKACRPSYPYYDSSVDKCSNSAPSCDGVLVKDNYGAYVCELPQEPDSCESLAEKCETLSGSLKVIDIKKSVDYRPFKTCTPAGLVPGCSKGCAIQSSGLGTYYKDQSGNSYFQGQGTVLAETCLPVVDGNGEPPKEADNPLPPSEPDEKPCKPGEYQGTVNGTKVCLPAKSSETLVKQETAENADGSKTETNVSVKCEGGKCTVTETATNKDSSGATTGTASKDSVMSQSNFCALNPGSEVCKSAKSDGEDGEDDKSTFTGSCDSNFKCEGDSVQCAIALEQHRTSCKLFDESNPYWQAFKDAEAGNSTGVEPTTVDLASHVTVDSVIGAGACPADVEVIVFNQTIPFPLSKFCPYFDTMGMLIMLGAAIGCLRILGSG